MLLTVLHYHSRQRKRNWDPTSLVAGGRADSGPVQGAGSLVQQQPIEEQGRPAEGDVLRGPDHGSSYCACVRALASVIVHTWVGCMVACDSSTRREQLQTAGNRTKRSGHSNLSHKQDIGISRRNNGN